MKKDLLEDVQRILNDITNRPLMYTPNGEFGEIISFVSGYVAGLRQDKLYSRGELSDFGHWLSGKFAKGTWTWWKVLSDGFNNNEERALKELPKLYEEFSVYLQERLNSNIQLIRETLGDLYKPQWVNFLSAIYDVMTSTPTIQTEEILQEILMFEGEINFDPNYNFQFPHSKSPEDMMKFIVKQYFEKKQL
jgi:hypothetical protein